MPVNYNFKRGVDLPVAHPLPFFPGGPSYHGTSNMYDGKRYIYWAVQFGSTGSVSTTQLWRYDTWSHGWQYLSALTNSYTGLDMEYDSVRNVLYIIHGNSTTTWQVFNLNTTAITIANVSCPAWAATTMTPVLPAGVNSGGSLTMPSDDVVPAVIDEGIADATGNTTTVIKATDATGTFGLGMIGLQVRITSGAQSGLVRAITAVSDKNTLTVSGPLPAALAPGDTYVIELAQGTTSAAGTTTTLVDSTTTWTTNIYTNHDVIITSGPLAGQRRRIASNTANTLTLAAAVTGNPRTGALASAPAQGVTYRIVPSQDFLYYQPGNNTTTLYRIDVAQTTGAAWSAALAAAPAGINGGGNTFYPSAYAPYMIVALRGGATNNFYYYNIGLNTWTSLTTFTGAESFNTGAGSAMLTGKRKLLVQKEGTSRLYSLDLLTGILEPFGTIPYAPPAGYEGKRLRVITTPDGVQFLYILRAGGQEFFRVPLEWV